MKKPRILVTGSTGALGKNLITKLKEQNYEYLGISRTNHEIKSQFNIIKCDICIPKMITSVIDDFSPDTIIHLAGLTGNLECERDPKKAFSTNVLGTYNILNASKKSKPKIIFASSREVYGNTNTKANENYSLKPININGTTKMISENIILNYNENYHIPYTILRFTNFFGENYSKRGISLMIKKIIEGEKISLFGGKQDLDLLYFDDAVTAIIKSINYKKSDIFNIGSGNSITPFVLLKKLEKIIGKKIRYDIKPYRNFEVKRFSINIEKSRKLLKFCASYNIDNVLRKMIDKWAM